MNNPSQIENLTRRSIRRSRRRATVRRRLSADLRRTTIITAVAGLVTSVALPAFARPPAEPETMTVQQVASAEVQRYESSGESTSATLSRGDYSASTPDEIAKKKAQEVAEARARALAQPAPASVDIALVAPSSGAVRWPLGGAFTITDRFGARGGAHKGTDMVAAGGTPIFASVDGVVAVSQDSYGAYGVAVTVDSVLSGQSVGIIYPHMQYGSRQVAPGQSVVAGQVLGYVGSTGRSTADHLHFEVYVGGRVVDSLAWLEANAG